MVLKSAAVKLKRGQIVWITKLRKFGEVLSVVGSRVEIQLGVFRTQVALADISTDRVPKPGHLLKPSRKESGKRSRASKASVEVDLHGLRVEEALRELDRAVNRAIVEDWESLRVVHGLGTGRVKAAVHAHLAGLSVVASFKLESTNPGVTIVYF